MSLTDHIRVNTYYTRSINLERDADSAAIVEAYIPTSRALKTLERIHESLVAEQAPRAWSLVGPYGSGKSSFAVFLSHLLEAPDMAAAKAAHRVLSGASTSIAKRFAALGRDTHGHCIVLLTGSPEPLAKALVTSAAEASAKYWANRRGRAPAIVRKLQQLAQAEKVTSSEAVKVLRELQAAIAKSGGSGVLIVIDELGKFLEYEARHYGANDIFLLQSLAEHAYAAHKAPLTIVALLHQSFEQYAKGLGESLKNEWAKVQGRYENIPFLESAEQVLRIVGAAFEHDITTAERGKIEKVSRQAAAALAKVKALPGALDTDSATALFTRCYPLHPVTALLLPILCQKVAQNERTLFSYLGSQESYGFRESLTRCQKVGDWIYPWEIYEYFIRNQPAALADHMTHRRWAEVVTAVERLGDAPDAEAHLLKTIGLLNIVGAQGGFRAAKAIIELCSPTKQVARQAAAALLDKSIIQFRKFSAEYRVWQGSDFDIDAAVEEERAKQGRFELADHLNQRQALLPVVARKYTIQTGTLRYYSPRFVDIQSYKKEPANAGEPRIIFFLIEGQDDERLFADEAVHYFSDLDVVVEYLNSPQLQDGVAEVLALEGVQHSSQELQTDPVAMREFHDRFDAAVQAESMLLDAVIDDPGSSRWYASGERLAVHNKRSLQQELSRVLQTVFHASPLVRNELINRDNPSSQAVAARNRLLFLLLNNVKQEGLGIEKFPPEKGIYLALLKASGLHRKNKGQWGITAPGRRADPFNFGPAWARIEAFFADSEERPVAFFELYEILAQPPYGVKRGVLPILAIAAYLVYDHELALYEDGVYSPYLTEEQIERFGRHPQTFAIQRFRIEGMRASIFDQYSKALFGDSQEKSVIELARPLAKFMGKLEDYTKRTKSPALSERAKAVRNAFNLAKSPQRLLFDSLPVALGFKISNEDPDEKGIEGFAQALTDALRELKNAYPEMLDQQRRLLAQAFHMDPETPVDQLRRTVVGRYSGLDGYTVDVDGLKAFIKRLIKSQGDDSHWFENVLMFLGQRPSKKWTDADRAEAEVKLSDYAKRILDLETLRLHYERCEDKIDGDFDVILLKSLKKGSEPVDEVVAIDQNRREAIQSITQGLAEALEGYKDPELRLAALAVFVDEFLNNRQATASQSTKSKKGRPKEVKNA